jgi:fatty-acyl-CoA synthase
MTSIYDSENKRFETVGKVLDHTEIKIVDYKTGKLLPIGQPGEIVVRGYLTFMGYWNQEEKTKEVLNSNRWYKTG